MTLKMNEVLKSTGQRTLKITQKSFQKHGEKESVEEDSPLTL